MVVTGFFAQCICICRVLYRVLPLNMLACSALCICRVLIVLSLEVLVCSASGMDFIAEKPCYSVTIFP